MTNVDVRGNRSIGLSQSGHNGETDVSGLLTVLDDENCRQLLEATSTDDLTANELATECNIPSSTVYRKLERLTELDLLQESIRIDTNGYHTKEYRLAVEEITVSIVDREGLNVEVSTGG